MEGKEKERTRKVDFRIPEKQLAQVDGLVGRFGFRDRSDIIRKAIKYFLENAEINKAEPSFIWGQSRYEERKAVLEMKKEHFLRNVRELEG